MLHSFRGKSLGINFHFYRNVRKPRQFEKFSTDSTAERLARLQRMKHKQTTYSSSLYSTLKSPKFLFFGASVASLGGVVYVIRNYPESSVGKMYRGSFLESMLSEVYEFVFGGFRKVSEPTFDKIIPDWGTDPYYQNQIPPGTPPFALLVVDVEKTLVGSEHTAIGGWKYAKRPGVDVFLDQLKPPYYEIVLMCETDQSLEFIDEIDKERGLFRVGPWAQELVAGNKLVKRLDRMNRDPAKILVIDDSAESTALCPRNTLLVKPFTDLSDTKDRVLYDLIPLLQALVSVFPLLFIIIIIIYYCRSFL